MHTETLKTFIVETFGTPCPVIDLDVVERNIARVQALCDEAGVANRPHIKTHKSPALAKMQIDAGAHGITCQKLGEAEVMVDAGIEDIVIATNLLGAARSGRLAGLLKRAPVKVCADNPVTLEVYADAARQADRTLDVMIECDTGQKRAGVETPGEALDLARIIKDDPSLSFAGLLFYPPIDGWPATQLFHDEVLAGLSEMGLAAGIVSTGGTPNLVHVGELAGTTEHRAGTCIF
ncbi:MAG: alanine racemase, partial [Methyloligellaceae bacterium]